MGGNPTGERGIVVDVKFQEVEKGVGDFGDGAVDILKPVEGGYQSDALGTVGRENAACG